MSKIKGLLDGVKIPILRIPTRRTPQQIEHQMREEMDRARVISLLNEIKNYFEISLPHSPEFEKVHITRFLSKISGMLADLTSYKNNN